MSFLDFCYETGRAFRIIAFVMVAMLLLPFSYFDDKNEFDEETENKRIMLFGPIKLSPNYFVERYVSDWVVRFERGNFSERVDFITPLFLWYGIPLAIVLYTILVSLE